MSKKLSIKLVKSPIGAIPKHRGTVKGLFGSVKLNKEVVRNDDACIRGMVNSISHLVEVKEV